MTKIQVNKKSFWIRKYYFDIVLVLVLVMIPFMGYLHVFWGNEINKTVVLSISLENRDLNNTFLVWLLLNRFTSLLILALWFFNCKQWWRNFILGPLGLLFYLFLKTFLIQMFIYQDYKQYILGICLICVFGILFIDHHRVSNSNSPIISINLGIKGFYRQMKDRFETHQALYSMIPFAYLKRLIYEQTLIEKRLDGLYLESTNKTSNRKAVNSAVSILLLVVMSSLLIISESNYSFFYDHMLLLYSFGFASIDGFLLYVSTKLFILITCCLWYFTSKMWWRYALLSPILIFGCQLYMGFKKEMIYLDEYEYLSLLPTILLLVLVLFGISRITKYQYKLREVNNRILTEIQDFLSKRKIDNMLQNRFNSEYQQLRGEVSLEKNKKDNLSSLFKLKEELEKQIDQVK